MKKKYIFIVVIALLLIQLSWIIKSQMYDGFIARDKSLEYHKAIDEIYSCDISGMSTMVMTTDKLFGDETKIYLSAAGNREQGFSSDNNDGVKLWAVKQLFMRLKELKVQKEGHPETFQTNESGYYVIEANHDYVRGKKITDIYYLIMFVDTQNYNIYVPKDYITLENLRKSSVVLREYKADNIAKYLIDTIVKLQN